MSVDHIGDREYQKFEVTEDDGVFVKTTGGLNVNEDFSED